MVNGPFSDANIDKRLTYNCLKDRLEAVDWMHRIATIPWYHIYILIRPLNLKSNTNTVCHCMSNLLNHHHSTSTSTLYITILNCILYIL